MAAPKIGSPLEQALAALRPGMPVQRVAEAMGDLWVPPAPHKGGEIDLLENSHGVVIRLDRDDVIGAITYNWRFTGAPVAGFQMGMTLAKARTADPGLQIGEDQPMMRGVRFGHRQLPDGAYLNVKFTLEKVNEITIRNRTAEYREPFAPPYPAPSGEPGAPFADVNFKLVVLSSLLDAKALDLGTPEQLAQHVLGRPVDLEDEGYDLIPEVLDYLARYPLDAALLAQCREIVFDGGNEIYTFPYYFWSGEDESFDVTSLTGIEHCTNLTSTHAISMIEMVDIKDVTGLPRLERLSISVDHGNLNALRDIPSLKSFRLLDTDAYRDAMTPGHPTRTLLDELKRRGVKIYVSPTTWPGAARPIPFE
ncbi:hypothetical protein JJJ17_01500 [Paracoccus caeni]|uniref:Uncharacterized protein n=1 Tax=Paracoccus caeni TaxID=657651 RepID=A0A934SG70_9RHOB|nr:hypothetical protein [Paracoccus caeni]MBK4214594.1 hypothetical protein [Paracoccus caeni]